MPNTRLADCDVHCAVPSNSVLYPYLPEIWQEWYETGNYAGRGVGAVSSTYPGWSPMTGPPAREVTLERIQEEVLGEGRADLAVLQCYHGVESFTHPYLAGAVASAVNDWLAAEWLGRDERLLGSAVVTPQYIEAAVAEVERIAQDGRFVQLLLPARSPVGYGNQRFWPLWEAAARHGLAVAITFGGGTGTPPTPANWLSSFYEEYSTATLNFQSHLMSLAVSGIFDRLPSLRFVICESGWTWLPSCMWRIDQEWRAFQREVPWMTGAPSTYIRRHFRFTTQPIDGPTEPRQLAQVLEHLDDDGLLMFGSDFPHRYARGADELEGLLSDDALEKLRWGNAASLYDLDARVAATTG